MPYTITWGNDERTIVIQTYHGDVTDNDYMQAVEESAGMLAQVEHPVDLIVDASQGKIKVSNLVLMMIQANRKVPDNQRLVIGIGAPPILKQIIMVGQKIAPKAAGNVHFVDTLEEAHQILAKK